MNIGVKLQNLDRINTISFGIAAFNYYGVDFSGDGGSFVRTLPQKLNQLLVEITDNKKKHNGLEFDKEDVMQWIDDLKVLTDYYKDSFGFIHISSSLKLKEFVSQLQSDIVKTTVRNELLNLELKKSDTEKVQSPSEIAAEEALMMYKSGKKK